MMDALTVLVATITILSPLAVVLWHMLRRIERKVDEIICNYSQCWYCKEPPNKYVSKDEFLRHTHEGDKLVIMYEEVK